MNVYIRFKTDGLLLFNFIFSNILLIYFLIAITLTALNIFQNYMLQIFILTVISLIYVSVRGFLETDAMTKSEFLVEKYMKKETFVSKEEQEELLKEYSRITKIGIPFTIDNLLTTSILRIMAYVLIVLVF